jgi:hypothetical protein
MRKNILLLFVLLSILSSCSEDLIDVKPTTQVVADDVFKTEDAIDAVRVGMYSQLAYRPEGSLYTLMFPILGDILGDDMVYGDTWYSIWGNEYSYNTRSTSSGPYQIWSQSYYGIEIMNTMINVDYSLVEGFGEDKAKQYIAESKALRAMVHVDLSRFFGKAYHLDNGASDAIPYIDKIGYSATPGDVDMPERNTMKEVYDNAIADLTAAIPDLPAVSSGNSRYMNKNAAQAVLARIYMDMHMYAEAKIAATAAMDGVSLMGQETYYMGGLSRINSESLLAFVSDKDKYSKWRTFTSFHDNWDGMGDDFRANETLVALFAGNDLRRHFFSPESDHEYGSGYAYHAHYLAYPGYGATVSETALGYYTYGKFPRIDSKVGETKGSLGLGEYNYIRGSEMVLIVAECAAREGAAGEAEAKAELLKIQGRMIAGAVESTNTGQDLLDEILVERRKELFGEGHGLRDILRLGKGLHRTGGNHTALISLPAGDPKFQWPVPQSEVDVNSNLKR